MNMTKCGTKGKRGEKTKQTGHAREAKESGLMRAPECRENIFSEHWFIQTR